ncbi:hypothetical protein C0J52_18230 [Blattella germanica]|nr:hypothetical protein C0J52_18230 [Blattella germanica]
MPHLLNFVHVLLSDQLPATDITQLFVQSASFLYPLVTLVTFNPVGFRRSVEVILPTFHTKIILTFCKSREWILSSMLKCLPSTLLSSSFQRHLLEVSGFCEDLC